MKALSYWYSNNVLCGKDKEILFTFRIFTLDFPSSVALFETNKLIDILVNRNCVFVGLHYKISLKFCGLFINFHYFKTSF